MLETCHIYKDGTTTIDLNCSAITQAFQNVAASHSEILCKIAYWQHKPPVKDWLKPNIFNNGFSFFDLC